MDTRPLIDNISVAPQISVEDVSELAASGVQNIINNRPDHEEPGQPLSAEIEAAAMEAGLQYHFLPVVGNALTLDDVARLQELLEDAEGPTLLFCRSGTRSATLWALSQAGRMDGELILKTAGEAGYDLSALRPAFGLPSNPAT